jgi:hypothetical protein
MLRLLRRVPGIAGRASVSRWPLPRMLSPAHPIEHNPRTYSSHSDFSPRPFRQGGGVGHRGVEREGESEKNATREAAREAEQLKWREYWTDDRRRLLKRINYLWGIALVTGIMAYQQYGAPMRSWDDFVYLFSYKPPASVVSAQQEEQKAR